MDSRIVGVGGRDEGEILFIPPQVQHTALWVATVCECVRRAAAAALSKRMEEEEVASALKKCYIQ